MTEVVVVVVVEEMHRSTFCFGEAISRGGLLLIGRSESLEAWKRVEDSKD